MQYLKYGLYISEEVQQSTLESSGKTSWRKKLLT